MTKEEINEGNILIAGFMGKEYHENSYSSPHSRQVEYVPHISELKYHSYWDWIMPVIEKLNRSNIWDEVDISHLSICLVSCDIDGVYKEIVDWIKWDNGDKE